MVGESVVVVSLCSEDDLFHEVVPHRSRWNSQGENHEGFVSSLCICVAFVTFSERNQHDAFETGTIQERVKKLLWAL